MANHRLLWVLENCNARQNESWDCLRSLASISNLPWCVMGDFNDRIKASEKIGGRPGLIHYLVGFQEALADCILANIGMMGYQFIWERGRGLEA